MQIIIPTTITNKRQEHSTTSKREGVVCQYIALQIINTTKESGTTTTPNRIRFSLIEILLVLKGSKTSGPSLRSLKVVVNISNPLIKDHTLLPVEPHPW